MYIKQTTLIEEVKKSIINNNITYIYGYAGMGKTTICNACLKEHFYNISTKIIFPDTFYVFLNSKSFVNEIYVLEDFNYEYIGIIEQLYNISIQTGKKFVLLSRDDLTNKYINKIDINSFDSNELIKQKLEYYKFNTRKLAEEIANRMFANSIKLNDITKLLLENPFNEENHFDIIYKTCIFNANGDPIEKIAESTKIIVTEINDQLLYELGKKPELLHNLSSYNFERVIARMFEKKGFTVKITPQTRDGGKDIFVAKNDLFSFLFYVECKKYAPNRPVGIEVIQRLYGVISAENATGGIIATTSHFTKSAKDYIQERQLEHRLELQDYNTISNILNSLQYNTQ